MSKPYKPFTSIDEQIALLKQRGVLTNRRTRWVLEREGYYPVINGYKDLFLDHEKSKRIQDDCYCEGTTFDDIYGLFVFDRKLRFCCFQILTLAEAILKTVCSYEFTKVYGVEGNPYLNVDSYGQDNERRKRACDLIARLRKTLDFDDGNKPIQRKQGKGKHTDKAYLRHCIEDHDGEVPMWVLANDLVLGQTYMFYQAQNSEIRKNIAQSFTRLYAKSHNDSVKITTEKLDKVYRRIKDFRNICAHDERMFCAHPHDKNITVFQLIKDLQYVTDKKRYLEFLQGIQTLITKVCKQLPRCSQGIVEAMGFATLGELDGYVVQAQKF